MLEDGPSETRDLKCQGRVPFGTFDIPSLGGNKTPPKATHDVFPDRIQRAPKVSTMNRKEAQNVGILGVSALRSALSFDEPM